MMIDNAFPVQMGGNGNTIGFLQQYVQGIAARSQAGEGIPDFGVQEQYAQESGGPLVSRTIRYSPPNAIIKAPHLDSPYMDKLFERDMKPMKPPGPKGPQLPSFV
jgi:hypothetical protein